MPKKNDVNDITDNAERVREETTKIPEKLMQGMGLGISFSQGHPYDKHMTPQLLEKLIDNDNKQEDKNRIFRGFIIVIITGLLIFFAISLLPQGKDSLFMNIVTFLAGLGAGWGLGKSSSGKVSG